MSITVTDKALSQMAIVCDTKNVPVVRYELQGGGCSGLQSKWSTELHYEPSEGDITWPLGQENLFVIDKFTMTYMDGATIDYTGDFMPAFKVTIPDRDSCGCGESFVA